MASKLFMSVFLPLWSVELHKKRSADSEIKEPIIITDIIKAKEIVVRTSPKAKLLGVSPGMTGANAKAMLNSPSVLNFEPEYERKALSALAEWSTKFSPFVAADEENSLYDPRTSGLYLDVSGSKLLFGSYEELTQTVSGELTRLGFSSRLAITPSYGASWALARYSRKRTNILEDKLSLRSALAPLPVSALRLNKAIEESLRQLNITRVEHLFSLPPAELNKRFDGLLTSRLKICLGEKEESIKTIRLPRKVKVNLVFDGLLTEQGSFVEAIKRCLEKLLIKLEKNETKLSALLISIKPAERLQQKKLFTFSQPTTDFKHIFSIISPWLEGFVIGFGIEELSLVAEKNALVSKLQADYLYADSSNKKDLGELLDNLSYSIGATNVLNLHTHQSYIPEESFSYKQGKQTKPEPILDAKRPPLLFENPEPVYAMAMLPDHPPFSLTWRGRTYKLKNGEGPERITAEWWKGDSSTRDYFKVTLENGPCVWLFRELRNARWFIHGLWS